MSCDNIVKLGKWKGMFGFLTGVRYICGVMTKFLLTIILAVSVLGAFAEEPITGKALVDAVALTQYVQARNPEFDPMIAEAFISVGERYGIRGDVALCQAVLETGWFRFSDGTAVTADQHNYCGMGVVKGGMKGASFDTIEDGVEAMIQHLFAYCSKDELPQEVTLRDPRFRLVERGCAPSWEGLSMRWAMNPNYGRDILRIYNGLLKSRGLMPLPEEAPCDSDEVSQQDLF